MRIRDTGLEIDELVFMKVSPMKCVMTFGKKGKLTRYVGTYIILKRFDNVSYELQLRAKITNGSSIFFHNPGVPPTCEMA